MKKYILFIFIAIIFLVVKNNYAQKTKTLKIITDSDKGFQYAMIQYSCDSTYFTELTKISEKEKEILISNNINNIVFTFFNSDKTAQIAFPIYLESDFCNIYIPIADTSLNFVQRIEKIKVESSKNTVDFIHFFLSHVINEIKQEKSIENFELLNHIFTENPNNYFAASILAQTVKDSVWLVNLIKTTNCKSLKNILLGLHSQNQNSKKDYSNLPYKDFIADIKTKTVSLNKNSFKEKGNGKIIFWASWCHPCIQGIMAMSNEEKNNSTTYFVSLDRNKEQCLKKCEELNLKNNVFIVTDLHWLGKYGIQSIPAHLIYDSKKKILLKEE